MRVPGNCLAVFDFKDSTVRYTTTKEDFSVDQLECQFGSKAKANKLITVYCRHRRAIKESVCDFYSLVADGYFEGLVYLYIPWTGWCLQP